jgi:hypothetical protein
MDCLLSSLLFLPGQAVLGWLPMRMSDVSLLASTVEISESVNRWFRRSSSASEAGLWGGIFLAIVSLWVGLYLWDRFRKAPKKAGDDREGLFLQLCDLHKLSKAERLLLKNVAKSQKLSQPALAFVDPRILSSGTRASSETTQLWKSRSL